MTFLIVLWGLFVTIVGIAIGWRAMRAHEKIAAAIGEHLKNKL